MRTVFVLSNTPEDAETATLALRESGYRPINPDEFGPALLGSAEQVKLALDSDLIVMAPDALSAVSTAVGGAILRLATHHGIGMTPIEHLVPAWRSRAKGLSA